VTTSKSGSKSRLSVNFKFGWYVKRFFREKMRNSCPNCRNQSKLKDNLSKHIGSTNLLTRNITCQNCMKLEYFENEKNILPPMKNFKYDCQKSSTNGRGGPSKAKIYDNYLICSL